MPAPPSATRAGARRELPDPPAGPGATVTRTRLGGLFYLLDAALALELYGDFTTPLSPGIELDPWDFVALLGAHLLSEPVPEDPVWPLLAELAGRPAERPPGHGMAAPRRWRMPAGWLAPFRCGAARRRPAATWALCPPPSRRLHRRRRPPSRAARCAARPRAAPAPAATRPGPARRGDPLERWVAWVGGYLSARIGAALNAPDPATLSARLLEHARRGPRHSRPRGRRPLRSTSCRSRSGWPGSIARPAGSPPPGATSPSTSNELAARRPPATRRRSTSGCTSSAPCCSLRERLRDFHPDDGESSASASSAATSASSSAPARSGVARRRSPPGGTRSRRGSAAAPVICRSARCARPPAWTQDDAACCCSRSGWSRRTPASALLFDALQGRAGQPAPDGRPARRRGGPRTRPATCARRCGGCSTSACASSSTAAARARSARCRSLRSSGMLLRGDAVSELGRRPASTSHARS